MKDEEPPDFALEFLLPFDGRIHWLEDDYFLKFEIKRVAKTATRPHGIRYSFTLHDPDGQRLIGFDNAHAVPAPGSRYNKQSAAADHWHCTATDKGRPYQFETVDKLLADFFAEANKVLENRGIPADVKHVTEKGEKK